MQAFKTAILVASLAALAGCANWRRVVPLRALPMIRAPFVLRVTGGRLGMTFVAIPPKHRRRRAPIWPPSWPQHRNRTARSAAARAILSDSWLRAIGRSPRFIPVTPVCSNNSQPRRRWPPASRPVQAIRTGARLNWPLLGSGMRNSNPNWRLYAANSLPRWLN